METIQNRSDDPKPTLAEQRSALAEALRDMANHVESGGDIENLARSFEEMSVGLERLAAASRPEPEPEKTESIPA